MKCLILILLFLLSHSAMADLEHKEGQGMMPNKQRLTTAHTCFQEIDNMGCGHPRNDQEFFIGCLEENKDKLTLSCQKFFQKLYGRKKTT